MFRRRKPDREPLSEEVRSWLAEVIDVDTPEVQQYPWLRAVPGYEPDHKARFFQLQCEDCGLVHFSACPKVAERTFHSNGAVKTVRYFEHWDDSDCIHPEQVFEEATG